MNTEDFKKSYDKLCNERIREFKAVSLRDKTVKNALYHLLKISFKSIMDAYFQFFAINACVCELNEQSLNAEINKIAPKTEKICELLDLVFDEIECMSCDLYKK